ncbi:hypothetical protein [Streptomyces sp. 061-3]|uniref:hypothetical protein n=1 Tax=Streptomyces sp. 061-3 TaxID=2789268 RepID=UPI00397E9332
MLVRATTINAHWGRASVAALTADTTPTGAKLSSQDFTACLPTAVGRPELPAGTAGSSRAACRGTNRPRANCAQPLTA